MDHHQHGMEHSGGHTQMVPDTGKAEWRFSPAQRFAGQICIRSDAGGFSQARGIRTAKFGAKRLEYRANQLKLEGKPYSFEAFGILFLLGGISVLLALYIDRRFIIGIVRRPVK